MGIFLFYADRHSDWLLPYLFNSPLLTLAAICLSGLAVFGLGSVLTGALRISEVRGALKRS